jgi:hypothetical protein
MAGLSFYDVTQEFRQLAINQELFFELDGHFNQAGHRYFGEGVARLIKKRVSTQ